ncbi:9-cis-epoxycarotenoid dioxygenase NCED1, chloroplastic [Vitis vinifera]|uniref:9-cis-epoxycarotenoid dioxygenase NCED1, chloroplastic n=1 Tax=Vitis vinifera TaxID=29760 RepID=A0A438H2E7_VITVI|nr:9-cis-epoxycarotenoid dioxygenase NCED1, chloroplastic [Vitis vinifera]
MPVSAELDKVPRIGVLPRSASTDSKIRWFEAPGFNAMHALNAWEEGDEEIILVAPNAISIENLVHNIEKVHFSLEKVRINLRNSSVSRTTLSQKNLELGSINPSYVGKRNRRLYGAGCFGGEPLFVAKDGASEEDDGYIVSYVHDEKSGASRFVVMDAKSQTLDVVATVKLPRRVPYGFHGLFVKDGDIREIY